MKSVFKSLLVLLLITSCDDIIEVEDISNKEVVILAPTNNAILATTDVTFSWQSFDDAEDYTIQIATPDFENALQIILDSTITQTNFTKTIENGNYEWRVKAKNVEYQTAYSSQIFTIEE